MHKSICFNCLLHFTCESDTLSSRVHYCLIKCQVNLVNFGPTPHGIFSSSEITERNSDDCFDCCVFCVTENKKSLMFIT